MKNFKYIIGLFMLTSIIGCSEDENTDLLNGVEAPTNVSALITITQDNTGMVTIQPNAEGVTSYEVFFGDASGESQVVAPGEAAEHQYAEGSYTVTIIASTLTGAETEYTQQLTVSFLAPQNLAVEITPTVGNPYQINVSATAELETYFEVWFGEDPSETPVQFNEDQVITHTYSSIGTYTVKVVAYSGGVATTEYTQVITIFDPLLLPLTFESPTLNYSFGDFGGAVTQVAANPSISGSNTSSKVAKLTKTPGAEVWAGTTIALDQPIDFSSMQHISIKTFSPVVGAVVKFKLENLNNASISTEVDMVTTVANDWEVLTFNFTGINNANNYQRIAIFYDFGNVGTGATFYFDDIMQTSGTPLLVLPLTFENNNLTYTFNSFGGSSTAIVNNPDPSGINTSAKVAQHVKNAGSEVWAGMAIPLATPIDFSTLTKIKVKVWSPQAGIPVLLKLENATTPSTFVELPATTTVANGWEELTYDFAGINNANNYQTLVLFFNFGSAGTGLTYYFDDIKLSN